MRLVITATCMLAASSAFATGQVERVAAEASSGTATSAAELFDRATAALDTKDYEQAAAYFEQAFAAAAHPVTLEYAIRARTEAKQLAWAATLSLLAQRMYPSEPKLNDVAESVINEASPRLQRVGFRCTAPCTLKVDDEAIPVDGTFQTVIFLDPGVHHLDVEMNGQRQAPRKIVTEAGQTRQLTLDLVAPSEQSGSTAAQKRSKREAWTLVPPAQSSSNEYAKVLFWLGVGLTAAAAGATAWSGIDAMNNPGAERIRNECGKDDTSCPVYLDGLQRQRRTNYLLGSTLVLGVSTAAVGLWLSPFRSEPASRTTRVERTPVASSFLSNASVDVTMPNRSGVSLSLQGRF